MGLSPLTCGICGQLQADGVRTEPAREAQLASENGQRLRKFGGRKEKPSGPSREKFPNITIKISDLSPEKGGNIKGTSRNE